jgi:hypothetical protein
MKGILIAWIAGQFVTIDESMIKYMGREAYIQYMPAKPIKHGIKVFALCCSTSSVLLNFIIYVGKESNEDGSLLRVCDKLIAGAGLTQKCG